MAEAPDPLDTLAANADAASGPMRWVRLLADEVGPRRPTSPEERRGAEQIQQALDAEGLKADLESFDGYSTFAAPFGVMYALALAPALLRPRRRLLRSTLATAGAAGLATEGGLAFTPISRALSRRPSQNLVATIEPRGEVQRTLCLVCHLDSSRSGLLFHPKFTPHLTRWLLLQATAVMAQAGEPLLGRSRAGRSALATSRLILAVGAALMAERELRGQDTPGANDNASGTAVVADLALEVARNPLSGTRLVFLMTGCEEAGLLGAQAFLASHDTGDWLFLNFDNVGGADTTLHFVLREGVGRTWPADPGLIALAEDLGARRPELQLEAARRPIGLTYDTTAVLARGGRALTFVAARDGVIPDYHWPTDTSDNVSPAALGRALEVGREMLAAIDRGEIDLPGQPDLATAASPS